MDTIPGFYYLEDARDDGFFSVRACPTPTTQSDFMRALACPIVAEVSTQDLENFLADFARETEEHYNRTKPPQKLKYASLGMVFTGLVGVGITIELARNVAKKTLSKKAYYSYWWASILITVGGMISGTIHSTQTQKNRSHYQTQQNIEQEIRSGVVGQSAYNRKAVLQQFTDFVNQYGVAPISETAAIASN